MSADDKGPDAHTLDTLTDDERQALLDHEADLQADAAAKDDDDDIVAVDASQGLPATAEAAASPAAAAPAAEAAPAAAAPASAPAAAPAASDDQVSSTEGGDDFALPPVAKLPEDFEARNKAIDERETAAYQQLEDGEIDQAALSRELRAINVERRELDRIQTKVDLSKDLHEQAVQTHVERAMKAVLAQGTRDGVNYKEDAAKWVDLRGFASALEDRHPDKSPAWILAEAHKRVLSLHEIRPTAAPAPAPAPASTPATPADKKAAAVAARKPDLAAAPQTLAQVPGGDGPGDVAGEFADILSLEGEEFEAAVARLTPAQLERFAAVG
jgi:hypothetical protein